MIRTDMLKIFIIAVLYFIGGKLSFYLSLENSIVSISIFFAEGIALASVLVFGKRALVGIFLGQFALAIGSDLGFFVSFLISVVNTLEALIAIKVLTLLGFDIKFRRIKDLYILFLVVMFVLQPFSALFGNIILLMFSIVEPSGFFQSFFSWWFGNVMGQFLVTPMLLLLYVNYKDVKIYKLLFYGLYFAVFNYVLIYVFMIDNLALILSIIVPFIMFLSMYEGLLYTLFSIFMMALTSLYTTVLGVGIFSNSTPIDNIININLYILAHIIISLINGILFVEKEEAVTELLDLNENLADIVKKEIQKNRQKEDFMLQQSRLAQMGEMISMIAHQWRQPLNTLSIVNQTLLLKYKRGNLNDDVVNDFKRDSNNQIKQMSRTIDDFRNFFKPDKEIKKFCISDALLSTLDIARPMLAGFNINMKTDIEKGIFVNSYQNELGQVILNIINNAKDALIENKIEDKIIYIKLQSLDAKVYITIEDNAGGIPKEIINDIFNPYFSTKESKNGTGLGLYMSKLIIEEHMSGKLVASNINDGAIFTISLKTIYMENYYG